MLGLCAPRSPTRTGASHDPNSSLSFEVIRVVLEQGAPHALIYAMERINLSRPGAGNVAAALLRPLEILTRSTVYNKVSEMVNKDRDKKKSDPGESKEDRRMTFGPSNRSESAFADDEMLEEGFDGNNVSSSRRTIEEEIENDIVVGGVLDDMEMDDFDESDNSESDSEDMEVRLGNVDFSDEDEEVPSDVEESSNDMDEEDSESSDDESEAESSQENSDDDDNSEIEDDDNGDMFDLDGTEQEVEGGWGNGDENNMFEEDLPDEFDEPNEAPDLGDEMGGWTEVEGAAGGGPSIRDIPGGFANMLMDALSRGAGTGMRGLGRGETGLAAVENMLGSFLREGRVQELEDTLGIRVVRRGGGGGDGDSGNRALLSGGIMPGSHSGLGFVADEIRGESAMANNSIVAVHQIVAPDGGYGPRSLSNNRSLAETLPMEYLFGGPAAGSRSEHYYHRSIATDGDGEDPSPLNSATSELFPGGLAASTHSRQSIMPHPLLANIALPPVNALLTSSTQSTRQSCSNDPRSRLSSDSGLFIRTQGGVMRVNRGPQSSLDRVMGRPTSVNTLSFGWVDDALPPENATEDFGTQFAQALITTSQAIQDDAAARSEAAANEDAPQGHDSSENANGNDAEVDASDVEDTAQSAEPEVSIDSGDNVDVSRLAISQQPTAPASNNDQPDRAAESNDAEPNDADMEDTGEIPPEDAAADVQDDSGQNDSHQSDEQNASNNEDAVDMEDADGEEEAGNPADEVAADGAENPNEEASQEAQLTCPPDVDPEVFNSLPLEMQQEICREHAEATSGIAAQIPEASGLDPEALA